MNTLQKRIYKIGIENCMFIAGFQPVCSILGLISYTSSSDEYIDLPATIVEDRYEIKDGYKITLKCMVPGFGKKHFYQMDLISMINQNYVKLYKKEKL